MDMIERRLTTDVTVAQAVIDVDEIVRYRALDSGRPTSLVRIGMAVDALGHYLVDAGAVLYPVAHRTLLSDPELTSKERMVLGRWADDGIIEVAGVAAGRAAEVADCTGLPLIAVSQEHQDLSRYPGLRDTPERLLYLRPRSGHAVLVPSADEIGPATVPVAIGTAAVAGPTPTPATGPAPTPATGPTPAVGTAAEPEPVLPAAVATFLARGAIRVSSTQVVRQRPPRVAQSGIGSALLARCWRCPEPDCPAFGEGRRLGQPVPQMRGGVPSCPRHGTALIDLGRRPSSYAMVVVVDDLARLRFAVADGAPVVVGRTPGTPGDIDLSEWLHAAAAGWISAQHLRLEVREDALIVVNLSKNGTLVWKRSGPDASAVPVRLTRTEHRLGRWDSIEPYTGIELFPGDHRMVVSTAGPGDLRSVLVDAPTVAMRLANPGPTRDQRSQGRSTAPPPG